MYKKLLLSGVIFTLLNPTVNATNGYFTHGIGTHNKALAGAGIASPSQAIDAANNPASGILVDDGWNVGIGLFSPRRSYTASTSMANGQGGAFTLEAGKHESGSEWFPIPYISKNWHLNNNSALTLSIFGRGGMNTDYTSGSARFDPDGPGPASVSTFAGTFGAGNTGVNLNQAFIELAYAYQLDSLVLGIAPVIAVQSFEANGLASFAPYTETFAASGGQAQPHNLTNNGTDYSMGYGAKVGIIWAANSALALAASYQSKIVMSEFDDYSDLFAEQGGFDIPASLRLGISYSINPTIKLHLDGERTFYNDVSSVSNSSSLVFNCPTAGQGGTNLSNCAGGDNGFGFGWDNINIIKLGVTWQPSSLQSTTFRAGYSHSDQPIPADDVMINILAPGVIEEHITFGVSQTLSNKHEWSLALMYAPNASVSGSSLFDPTQEITLEMDQFELEFGYNW